MKYVRIGDKLYPWKEIVRLKKEQTPPPVEQPTLFPLKEDVRPQTQATASKRFAEPTLFDPR